MQESTFRLSSTAFEPGGAIPRQFTCDGEDTSPDLTWAGAPDGTQALALIVTDPDARGFVHWIAFDLTGTPSGGPPSAVRHHLMRRHRAPTASVEPAMADRVRRRGRIGTCSHSMPSTGPSSSPGHRGSTSSNAPWTATSWPGRP
jgi:hypothetical protein